MSRNVPKRFLGHVARRKRPLGYGLGDAARGAGDLVAGPVVEGDDQIERGIVLGELDGVVDQPEQVRLESASRPDHANFHTVLVQIGQVAADEAAQEAEQVVDLLPGARPVLRGEAEQREMGNAELERGVDRAPYAFDALAMAFDPGQAAFGGPASVAVHDDRDMAYGRSVGRLPRKLIDRKRHVGLLRIRGKFMSTPPPG